MGSAAHSEKLTEELPDIIAAHTSYLRMYFPFGIIILYQKKIVKSILNYWNKNYHIIPSVQYPDSERQICRECEPEQIGNVYQCGGSADLSEI